MRLAVLGLILVACGGTSPPDGPAESATQFTVVVKQSAIDKIDLLFVVDNDRGMADKQNILVQSDLIRRLLVPDCIDASTNPPTVVPRSSDGTCRDPAREEFKASTDVHIAVISSSLGPGGAEQVGGVPGCSGTYSDDYAHVLGGDFLAWLPDVPQNIGKTPPSVPVAPDMSTLATDFSSLVMAGEQGCALEAQLESWYRFLIQPDPYASIHVDTSVDPPKASLVGIDATILEQRHDFLRNDSLLVIVQLTDKDDAWSDPLAQGGRGWMTRLEQYPGSPTGRMPRPTSACQVSPDDPNCTSCGLGGNMANGQPISSDPNCQTAPFYTPAEDGLGARYTDDMKRRYGFDPQYPIQRYVDGLKSLKVHNRNGVVCTNPLFARSLPTDPNDTSLCDPTQPTLGPRSPDLVYYSLIGGVPWQLLYDPMKLGGGGFKDQLTPDDWKQIIGEDPAHFDLSGIDPHMLESIAPRPGLPPPTSSDSGRDWDTTQSPDLDLQSACVFDLPTPRDCAYAPCDFGPPLFGPNPNDGGKPTLQLRGRARPSIRALRVAHGLGGQAGVTSICPETLDPSSPDFGYRHAIRPITEWMIPRGGSCFSVPLHTRQDAGGVACLMLETLPAGNQDSTSCNEARGLREPDPDVLRRFNHQRCVDAAAAGVLGDGGGGQNPCANPDDAAAVAALFGPVCELVQLVENGCDTDHRPGWCYVTGVGGCPEDIKFSPPGTPTSGAKISLTCFE